MMFFLALAFIPAAFASESPPKVGDLHLNTRIHADSFSCEGVLEIHFHSARGTPMSFYAAEGKEAVRFTAPQCQAMRNQLKILADEFYDVEVNIHYEDQYTCSRDRQGREEDCHYGTVHSLSEFQLCGFRFFEDAIGASANPGF